MAGIYIHIPFCKQACFYCDFHFSTSNKFKNEIVKAICKEIELRKNELLTPIETIYFGGGTPSFLPVEDLKNILETVKKSFDCTKVSEITLEANPDDLSKNYLLQLKEIEINRLSIGIQTFSDQILKQLNRAHSSNEAIECVKNAREIGFDNINLDIIFGLPGSNLKSLRDDVKQFMQLKPEHISAYWLTIEDGTAFGNWTNNGKLPSNEDLDGLIQWNYLRNELAENGYEQYEISNYSLKGKKSIHNSSYWDGKHYVGIGPSAHSFNGQTRKWNISNNKKYLESIQKNTLPLEIEEITHDIQINEYIMTKLRTKEGLSLKELKERFNYDLLNNSLTVQYIKSKDLILKNDHLQISIVGQKIVDEIASELFIES